MRVTLAFATADAKLLPYLRTQRQAVLPAELRNQGYWKGCHIAVQFNEISLKTSADELGKWLRRLASAADALILIVDEDLRGTVHEFEDAYFVVSRPKYPGKNMQNELRAVIAPALKHFGIYLSRFNSLRNQRILLLPLDIFQAAELDDLRQRLTFDKMEPQLAEDLDLLLSELNDRARPKTKTRKQGKAVHLVDDRPLFYRYGPEHHALPETGRPPHAEKCWHNSLFRFGRAYDGGLHHNVDDGDDPSHAAGKFVGCHGQMVEVMAKPYLNIFPNGHV